MTIFIQPNQPSGGADGDRWYDSDDDNRRHNRESGVWVDAGIHTSDVHRETLLDAVQFYLVDRANIATVYHRDNLPSPGGGQTVGIDSSRVGDATIYMQDFISLNTEISDDDIIDTITSTALRCTQVRQATYTVVASGGESESSDSGMFRLDIQAQQWYEEFNQLGRKYLIEAERDIIQTGVIGENVPTADGLTIGEAGGQQSTSESLNPDHIEGAIELASRVLAWHRAYAPIVDIRTCHGECFSSNTSIVMSDGTLEIFDSFSEAATFDVIAYDAESKVYVEAHGEQSKKYRDNVPMMDLQFGKQYDVRCTLDHEFWLQDGKKVKAIELKVGDSMRAYDPEFPEDVSTVEVTGFDMAVEPEDAYCITVPAHGNFVVALDDSGFGLQTANCHSNCHSNRSRR